MRTLLVVFGLLILGATSAEAADIQGKWGIGAGIIGRGGELSLIRGHSDRTAWLLQLRFSGSHLSERLEPDTLIPPPTRGNENSLRIAAGPGFRRFTRPASEFSPYFDVTLMASYDRLHRRDDVTASTFGTTAGLGFGLEYFTRWHFSVAAHSPLADMTWLRTRSSYGAVYSFGPYDTRTTEFSANIGLSPSLFVRAYF